MLERIGTGTYSIHNTMLSTAAKNREGVPQKSNNLSQAVEGGNLQVTTEYLELAFEFLLAHHKKQYELLMNEFERRIEKNNKLLRAANINVHDLAHMQWVSAHALLFGLFLRASTHDVLISPLKNRCLLPAALGGLFHDIGYDFEGRDPASVSKEHLKAHPEIGAALLMEYLESMPKKYRLPYEQRTVARDAVLYHSGDSEPFNPKQSEVAALLIRLFDKLQHMHTRVHDGAVPHQINIMKIDRDKYPHRIVPYLISDIIITFQRQAPFLSVRYVVDLEFAKGVTGKTQYTQESFKCDFYKAYRKHIEAAEEALRLILETCLGTNLSDSANFFEIIFDFDHQNQAQGSGLYGTFQTNTESDTPH